MKGKVVGVSFLFLLVIMVSPVLSKPIGPYKAVDKNPHLMVTPEGVEAILPNGAVQSWTNETEFWYFDYMHALNASKGSKPKGTTLTIEDIMATMANATAAMDAVNKWWFMSYDVLLEMFLLEGMDQAEAEALASLWQDGLHLRFINVGKPNIV